MNTVESYALYSKDYKITTYLFIIFVLILFSAYTLSNYNYKTFYYTYGIINNIDDKYYLVVLNDINDNSYLINNNHLFIDNNKYLYQIYKIEEELKIEENLNYQIFYLDINLEQKYLKNNLIVNIKILKEDKPIIKYLL